MKSQTNAERQSERELVDDAIATGSSGAMPEQLEQLDQLVVNQRNF